MPIFLQKNKSVIKKLFAIIAFFSIILSSASPVFSATDPVDNTINTLNTALSGTSANTANTSANSTVPGVSGNGTISTRNETGALNVATNDNANDPNCGDPEFGCPGAYDAAVAAQANSASNPSNTTNNANTNSVNANKNDEESAMCGAGDWVVHMPSCIGIMALTITGKLVGLTGVVLNYTIDFTIVKMADFVNSSGGIHVAWKTLRDLANIFFIFMLLYIAIRTILLGLDAAHTKDMIVWVIISALFINFSLFATKFVIDASNITTMQFYKSVLGDGPSSSDAGLSYRFLNITKLTTLYKVDDKGNGLSTVSMGNNTFTVGIMGSIFGIILSVVFLAFAIMLVQRFVTFLVVMILSPIAFLGLAIPKVKKAVTDPWFSALIDNAIFAPVMMIMLWVVLIIITDNGFTTAINQGSSTDGTMYNALSGGLVDSISVVLNFAIVIGLLVATLVVAKKTGAGGAGMATTLATGVVAGGIAKIGRGTIGRGANALANSQTLQRSAATNMFARGALKGAKGVAGTSFDLRDTSATKKLAGISGLDFGKGDGKGGYKERLASDVKKKEEEAAQFKDVKLYSEEGKKIIDQAKTKMEAADKNIERITKDINKAKAEGGKEDFVKQLEEEKHKALYARKAAEKEAADVDKNPEMMKKGNEAFIVGTQSIIGRMKYDPFKDKTPNSKTDEALGVAAKIFNPSGTQAAKKVLEQQKEEAKKSDAKFMEERDKKVYNEEVLPTQKKIEEIKGQMNKAEKDFEEKTKNITEQSMVENDKELKEMSDKLKGIDTEVAEKKSKLEEIKGIINDPTVPANRSMLEKQRQELEEELKQITTTREVTEAEHKTKIKEKIESKKAEIQTEYEASKVKLNKDLETQEQRIKGINEAYGKLAERMSKTKKEQAQTIIEALNQAKDSAPQEKPAEGATPAKQ